MKKMLLFLSVLVVFGCASDDSESNLLGLDYYKFSSSDNDRLLNSSLNKGKTVTFRNQSGQTISYKVTTSVKRRTEQGSGTFSGNGLTDYYFDEQIVSLDAVGFENNENSGIYLWVYKSSAFGLTAQFNFDRWNDGGYYGKEEFVISNISNLQTISTNGKTFGKVIVVNSNLDSSVQRNGFPINAFKVYYDLNYGIVGFDDVEGNEWRLD